MAKAKFFQRESLFKPTHIEHKVNGRETMRFYPLSVNMLWKMRTAVEPLAEALRVIASGKNDFERTVDQDVDPETGSQRTVTHLGAVKPEIATLREKRLDESIGRAMDAFFDPQFRTFVGEMIADSLRDEFTRSEARDPDVISLLMEGNENERGLDIATLTEMVTGLVKANMRVFGPFGQQVQGMMSGKMSDLLADVSEHGIEAKSDSPDSTRSGSNDEPENLLSSLDLDPSQSKVG